MLGRRMPWAPVPCSIWLPTWGRRDAYGNENPTYAEEPSITTTCCYAPGYSSPETSDDYEEERPHGSELRVTFFLPKTLDADLRAARIACHPTDDPRLADEVFDVVGDPRSYMRSATPGDYSWVVEGVARLG